MTRNYGSHTRIGFIGLGIMGAGMAHCLLRAGHALRVHARRPDVAQAFAAAGAGVAASPAELGRACELVFLCLSDDAAVEQVLFGPEGLAEGLSAGSCVVDASTIAAASARAFGERLRAKGIAMLDAPISGGQQGAESGTLNTMVGGDADVVEACRPVLAAFCKSITHVGALGAGQTVKSCNQVAVAGALLGVADAIVLAKSQGVDPAVMREVLLASTARSLVLERHGQRVVTGDFEPGFRASLMRKDLRIALRTAGEAGAFLAAAPLAERLLDEAVQAGQGDLDWAVIGRLVQEKKAGT